VLSLLGPFIAHETVRQCRNCQSTEGSEALLNLVPARCNVAYDVLVYVGWALFKRHRTMDEVRVELRDRNIHISASEIAWLGRKFIMALAMAHRLAKPRLQQTMRLAGGYILHLDATHDGEAPALTTGLDGISSIVLDNIKVPSEHSDFIIPFLQKLNPTLRSETIKLCNNNMLRATSLPLWHYFFYFVSYRCLYCSAGPALYPQGRIYFLLLRLGASAFPHMNGFAVFAQHGDGYATHV
jgi:hypothetical protein